MCQGSIFDSLQPLHLVTNRTSRFFLLPVFPVPKISLMVAEPRLFPPRGFPSTLLTSLSKAPPPGLLPPVGSALFTLLTFPLSISAAQNLFICSPLSGAFCVFSSLLRHSLFVCWVRWGLKQQRLGSSPLPPLLPGY